MALELGTKTISYDLSAVVNGAISAARSEKASKASKVEADFQKAVADGQMDYASQLAFREKQLDEEKTSYFSDPDLQATLAVSIGETKKLIRYEKYRSTYYKNYSDMAAGRITAKEQLDFLNRELGSTTDPELKAEIQKSLVEAERDVTDYENTITTNLITRATQDKTEETLNSAISRVKERRALASLGDNEDEVSGYDLALSSLESQLSKVEIEDSMNKIEIDANLKGVGAINKVNLINDEIGKADGFNPITIEGQSYNSAKDFWTQTRDNYLAGSGKGIFSDFSRDITSGYDETIRAANARDGFVNSTVLDTIKNDFDSLESKAEFQPFLNKITNLKSIVLGAAIESTAKRIIDFTTTTGEVKDFQKADVYLQDFQNKYGIDMQGYKLDLNTKLSQLGASIEDQGAVNAAANKLTPENFPIPSSTGATVAPVGILPTENKLNIPQNTQLALGSTGAEVVKLQEQLGLQQDGIFGIKTQEAVKAYQTNNGLLSDGIVGSITSKKLGEINPVIKPPTISPPTPTPSVVTPPVVTPPMVTPKPTSTTPAVNSTGYQGASIVDYLSSVSQDSSYSNRKKLADSNGIMGYTGSAGQNTTLLVKLRGF